MLVDRNGDPRLARVTAAKVCRVAALRGHGHRIEVLSFYAAACEEAAQMGLAARLVVWADYEPDALTAWAASQGIAGVCIEHFLLRRELVSRLRLGGLSVTTGTINEAALARPAIALGVDAITTDRPAALRHELTATPLAA